MKLDLKMTAEQASLVQALIPLLGREHVEELSVFAYNRPGEQHYWLAYLFVEGIRHVAGTPELRNLPLEYQLEDLLSQLGAFQSDASRR